VSTVSVDVQVLGILYQSERADRSATLTVSLATMGAAVTYLIGTIAFSDKLHLLGWAIALLPFPLICIAAFHSLLLTMAAVRARSILQLEAALLGHVAAAPIDRARIGVTASEHRTNVHTAPTAHRAAVLIAYGGVGASYLAYTVWMLWQAAEHLSWWVTVPATAYAALLVPIGLSWRQSVSSLDLRDPVANPATGPDEQLSTN
jgi:hypothetical protein